MSTKSGPSVLILIADGTEEMEFTITYDTLVRAGISCTSAYVVADSTLSPPSTAPATASGAVPSSPVVARGSRGIRILPDTSFSGFGARDTFDALVIPGGAQGAATISKSPEVQKLVRDYVEDDKIVGMICADMIDDLCAYRKFDSSYVETASYVHLLPDHEPFELRQSLRSYGHWELRIFDFEYSEDAVVVSKNLVTSRGPGTAFPFALTLISLLLGTEKREEVSGPMCFPSGTPW